VDSRPDSAFARKTEDVELIESDSPLFMKERNNSYEASPDMHREGGEHFQNIEPVFAKKKARL